MFSSKSRSGLSFLINETRRYASNDVTLSTRRALKKIKIGKARPAIFHQFDQYIELTDGSVIKRKSQIPKDEIHMLNDQRNSLIFNPSRTDFVKIDPTAVGKVNKFKKKFASFDGPETASDEAKIVDIAAEASEQAEADKNNDIIDDYAELMSVNVVEVQAGGKLQQKKKSKKK